MRSIELTQGKFAKVDDEDFEWLNQWKWSAHKDGNTYYAVRSVRINGRQKKYRMHRLIMGENILSPIVDHRDGDGLNNQRYNLRHCTNQENRMNQRPQKNCSSIYRGVSWNSRDKIWEVAIKPEGKCTHLGRFIIEEDAARAFDVACIKYHKEFARPNFPLNCVPNIS